MTNQLSTSRQKQWEWLLLILALALVGAVLVFMYVNDIDRVNASERDRLHTLSNVIAKDIERNLAVINVVLEGVIQDYLAGPDAVHSQAGLSRRLRALDAAMPGIRSLAVLDANGLITAASSANLIGDLFFYRDYFQTVRDRPDKDTLYLSAPFKSWLKDDMVMTVARMVPGPSGEFSGVVLATLDPQYLNNIFRSVVNAPDRWAFVAHGSGQQWINFPEKKDLNGIDLNAQGTFFSLHRQTGHSASMLTGSEQRLVAMRTIQPGPLHMDQPVVIGISRNLAIVTQPLRHEAITVAAFFATLVLLCCTGLRFIQTHRARINAFGVTLNRERLEAAEHAEQELTRKHDEDLHTHALRESEARFRTLIEDAPLAIAILRGGHFVYANPRYRMLHGYLAADELNGLAWSTMLSAESGAALHLQQAAIVADCPAEQMFEALGLGKNGDLVPTFKTSTRVMLADGPATLLFAQNISAQKHAESAMRQAREDAEAANRSKAEFLANMSHEIRSPLNAILGLTYLLEQAHLDLDADNMVSKIRTSGRLLLEIINDILDASKIEAGRMLIERAPFRLSDVLENLANTVELTAVDQNVELIIQPPPAGIFTLMGDALRLGQVLINLTSNAIKFTEGGRVELRITLLSSNGEDIVLHFCVKDNGIGIAPELQSGVFAAFAQADSSTTRRFGGTGLGLTICHQLVNLMEGEIGLISSLGQGSEFWFTLPLQHVAGIDPASDMARDVTRGEGHGKWAGDGGMRQALRQRLDLAGIRLLVVDDSGINREVAQRILSDHGAMVALAVDGKAALDWLLLHPGEVDLVLMDIQMPVMDGIQTTRQLRLMPQFDDLPIVALTAGAFKLQQDAAHAAGMSDFISKPFDVPSMIALIQRLRRRPAADGPAGIASAGGLDFEPASGLAVMNVARGLQIWSDRKIYQSYLRRFIGKYGSAVDVMNASLASAERPAAAALAHKLAGVAANLGLPDTHRLAGAVERALATECDPTRALAQLRDALEHVKAGIEQLTQGADESLPVQHVTVAIPLLIPAALGMLLKQLLAALDTDNPSTVEPILAVLEKQVPMSDLMPIWASVRDFDFRGAETNTHQLASLYGIPLNRVNP